MFQNKHIVQWVLYMTICTFVLTACKNEKVIEDKRKDTKTSESTALPCEQSYIDWNNSVARKNGKLYFAIEIKMLTTIAITKIMERNIFSRL